MNPSARRTLLILGIGAAWALTSATPIWKYLSHPKAIAALLFGLLSIAIGMYAHDRLNRQHRQIGTGWFPLLFAVLIAALVIAIALFTQWTLPSLGVFIACSAFPLRMDLPRLFLIFSASSFVMLAPFVITFALHAEPLRYAFFYLSICTMSFALWALSQYERPALATPNPVNSI